MARPLLDELFFCGSPNMFLVNGNMFLENGNMFLVNGKPFWDKSQITCGYFKNMLDAFLKQLQLETSYQMLKHITISLK